VLPDPHLLARTDQHQLTPTDQDDLPPWLPDGERTPATTWTWLDDTALDAAAARGVRAEPDAPPF
jgi:hypothetical protein